MSRLSRLQRLTEYLAGLKIHSCCCCEHIDPICTTAQSDATSKLAHLSGVQVVVARPEVHQRGDSDSFREELWRVSLVWGKGLGRDKSEESDSGQYSRRLEIADLILAYIAEETSSQNCRLVTGLSLASVDVVPESSVFGGWSGYSIELAFE